VIRSGGWAIVERLLADLMRLAERVWLIIDDVHELASVEAVRQHVEHSRSRCS
jgi:LuxR family maltose regulon positive regulatory protein